MENYFFDMAVEYIKEVEDLQKENKRFFKGVESLDSIEELFSIIDETRQWIKNIKQNFFHLHSVRDSPDQELSEIYWKYFNNDDVDFDELLESDDKEKAKKELKTFFEKIKKFFSKIEENPNFKTEECKKIAKYRYRKGCTFKKHFDFS